MEKSIFEQVDNKEEWKRLKNAIKVSGFSVNAVCKEAKVSPSTTFAWDKESKEKGAAEPSSKKLNDIKSGLKCLLEKREKNIKTIK